MLFAEGFIRLWRPGINTDVFKAMTTVTTMAMESAQQYRSGGCCEEQREGDRDRKTLRKRDREDKRKNC